VLDGALDLAQRDVVPSGSKRNHAWLSTAVDWKDLTRPEQIVLADAQTSGGLLLASADPGVLLAALSARGAPAAAVIGEVIEGQPGTIAVTGRLAAK
jgi:selenide,water dikinase